MIHIRLFVNRKHFDMTFASINDMMEYIECNVEWMAKSWVKDYVLKPYNRADKSTLSQRLSRVPHIHVGGSIHEAKDFEPSYGNGDYRFTLKICGEPIKRIHSRGKEIYMELYHA